MSYEKLPKINSRKEMYGELDSAINNISKEEEREEDEYKPPRKYLKALIIESNSPLEKISPQPNIEFLPTREPEIKIMKTSDEKNTSYSYLDMLDPRFWVLYSLDDGEVIKKDVRNIIENNNSRLDYTWFSSNSLFNLGSKYSKTSFSMKYYNTFRNKNIPLQKLSIRLWAEDASEIISNLFENDYIGKGACLSNIEVVHSSTGGSFVKTRLSMKGCINISKGNSLENFLEYMNQTIQGYYKPKIELIESTYTTEYSVRDGLNIKGTLLSIKLKEKLSDINSVCNDILKGTRPFRMTGFVNKISEGDYLLNVLDLHNANRFDLEVFEDEILINLPKQSCGNIVTRLFALCQERVDPKATLMGDSHAII